MGFFESLAVGLFTMLMVFALLLAIYGLIRVSALIISLASKKLASEKNGKRARS
ncbi:MAG: hypothetical protein LBC56_00260 [Oscillospiraceae bacterium]|jgi:hypothetical protein|nr:hypothetical protein [Oscillospiraceae bacterium]